MTTRTTSSLDVHRLLDEAFAGSAVTPDVQDLKEEMRASLVARAAELEADGLPSGAAAQRALDELGDVRAAIEELGGARNAPSAAEGSNPGASWQRHRVRPRPGYVVRTVLVSLLGVAALATAVVGLLGAANVLADVVPDLWSGLALVASALIGGMIVADALRQETTTNYPVPPARAAGYGLAMALGVLGLGGVGWYAAVGGFGWLIGGSALVIVAVCVFAGLGATQTNRHKPWVMRMRAHHAAVGDRFERDPAAAARFGIYTAVIMMVTVAVGVALGLLAGWAWSLFALLGGGAVMMLTLARMLFGSTTQRSASPAGSPSA